MSDDPRVADWSTLAQSAGVAALALPAIGAGIRFVSFTAGGVEAPGRVAVGLSPSTLAAEGAIPLVVALAFSAALVAVQSVSKPKPAHLTLRRYRARRKACPEQLNPVLESAVADSIGRLRGMDRWLKGRNLSWPAAYTVILAITFAMPGGIAAPVLAIGLIGVIRLADRAQESGRSSWTVLVPSTVLLMVTISVAAGLSSSPSTVSLEAMHFTPNDLVGSGDYLRLGGSDGYLFLARCEEPDEVIEVRDDLLLGSEILHSDETDSSPLARSLLVALWKGDLGSVGFRPTCADRVDR